MKRLPSVIARVALGTMILVSTLVSTGSSAIASGDKFVQLVGGSRHACGLLVSGSVKCWGDNYFGELGLGYATEDEVSSPALVPGLTDVASLVLGGNHACAVLVSGSVKCWGSNQYGQLGDTVEPGVSVSSPTLVPGLTDVASLVLGGNYTCAVLVSGSVKCWGYNQYGQLGLGYTGGSVSSPTLVPGLTDVASLVLGGNHACVVLVSGSVKCWGYNGEDELGLGYTVESVSSPTLVPGLTDVASLVLGGNHTCAVIVSGTVKCWGFNYFGQLGLGTSESVVSVSSPTLVPGLTDVASLVSGDRHTCAVLVSGSVKCWGFNLYGQLGLSYISDPVSSPTLVPRFSMLIPAKPVIASVVAGNASVTVNIKTPTDVTARSVTGYQYSINKGATYQNAVVRNGSFTINGLTNGVSTSVQIRATSFNCVSLASLAKSVVPATSPAAPSITTITPSAGALSIAFSAPSNGGSAITGYQYSLDGGSTWIVPKIAVKTSPLKVTGLPNATTYQVAIRAVNAKGIGLPSEVGSTSTPPLVPSAPVTTGISKTSTTFTVDVAAPVNNGGGTITNYAYSVDNAKTWTVVNPASNSTRIVITGLKPNTVYPVQVAAINSAGRGAFSAKYTATTLK